MSGVQVLACPSCTAALVWEDRSARCEAGHTYDQAKEGYVNLLLAQHRSSKDPGYSKEMIASRRDFFDAGHYEPLADGVAQLLLDHLPERVDGHEPVVLDAGCGEGYYLRRLRRLLVERDRHALLVGLDISKHGIKVAARRDRDGLYAVAGTYRMPVLEDAVDVLLTHFSPVAPEDFRRVVRPGGLVVVGGPGEGHLYDLKTHLYDRPESHAPTDPMEGVEGFERVEVRRISYPLVLDGPGQAANLLLMTPYYWSAREEQKARLAELDHLETTVDVLMRVYRRV